MAYACLLSLTQTIEQILQPQFYNEFPLFLDEEKLQLRSLHEKLSNLLLFLENSSPKDSEKTSSVERRIRDAAYEAEDLVESHMAEKSFRFQGITSCFWEIIQPCARCLVSTTTNQTFEESLQNEIQKLSSISEEVEKMKENNVNRDEALQPSIIKDPLESNATIEMEGVEEVVKVRPRISSGAFSSQPAFTNKSSMVGFEDDMLRIKEILIQSSTQLETILIDGMGGIGKTTLATNIYNDSMVNRHFDIQAWITVSQEYDVVALLASLLRSTGGATVQIKGEDETILKLKLYQSLKRRRYLIVMDDVWDDNFLDKFRNIFPDDNNGSRIIMTSRSSKVAGLGNSSNYIHHLNFLSPDQSWNLLCQEAFGEERCPRELEDIGKRIAENCSGLALSLVAIGGVLHKAERTLAHWEYVESNMKCAEIGNYERSMEILSWSYNQLPYHLRACFLYMGAFDEDFVVRVSHLIMLWVANGFIKTVSSKTLEEVAMEYLEDLNDRNLIMIRERGYCRGEIKTCVMHDLMRKMCIEKAEEEKFLLDDRLLVTSPVSLKGYRHRSFDPPFISMSECADVSTLRSIRCFFEEEMLKIMSSRCLKVFDGCPISFERFPIELIQLVNLRFIALVCEGMSEVPVSLSKLPFLRTLLIFRDVLDKKIIIIPSKILKMPRLMHLLVEGGELRDCSGGRMEDLQTLCGLTNFVLTKQALAIFPNLKTLKFSLLSETSVSSSCLPNLVHLECLRIHNYPFSVDHLLQPPPHLSFPVKLRKLSLHYFILSQRQLSTIGKLPNLEVLKLKSVMLSEGLKTDEGDFGELKFLFMRITSKFSWNLEGDHFPSLECLTLEGFEDCLPSEFGEIPNLKAINLYGCSSFAVDSASKILEDREQWGNYMQINVHRRFC